MAAQSKKNVSDSLTDEAIREIRFDDLEPGMRHAAEDVAHVEGILTAWDGTDLFWQTWAPQEGTPRGVVGLMHGFGEHSTRYHHFASFLVRAGYVVGAIDARGHGRSAGNRGHITRFEEYPRDFDRLLSELESRWPHLPMVGFGHSNGGLIAMYHALMAPARVVAYAVTSPFLGFEVKVPLPKYLAATAMSRVWPSLALPTELDPAVIAHNEKIVAQYAADPLVGRVASSRWLTETKRGQEDVLERAAEIRVPVLFLVSGDDQLADADAAEKVYHALGSREREYELLPDLKHEVLNEEGWEDQARKIVAWYERFR